MIGAHIAVLVDIEVKVLGDRDPPDVQSFRPLSSADGARKTGSEPPGSGKTTRTLGWLLPGSEVVP